MSFGQGNGPSDLASFTKSIWSQSRLVSLLKKERVTEPQINENSLQKLPKKSNNHGRKNIVSKHKNLKSFGAYPTLNIGNTSLMSDLKLRIQIHEKGADTYTILKCVILIELKRKEQEMFKSESVELGIIPIGSVISEIPMMRTSESISSLFVATPKKALKPSFQKWVID